MPDLRELLQALTPSVPLPEGINTATGTNGIDAAGDVLVYEPPSVDVYYGSGGPFLPLGGGTMQGPLYLSEAPVQPMEAATKAYVDALLVSPAFTGTPTAPTAPVSTGNDQLATTAFVHAVVASGGTFVDAPADGTAYGRLNNNWANVLPLTGGALSGGLSFGSASAGGVTLTRHLMLYGTTFGIAVNATGGGQQRYIVPAGGSHAFYVGNAAYLYLGSSSVESNLPLFLPADPTAAMQAATKQYVDAAVAALGTGPFLPLSGGVVTGTTAFNGGGVAFQTNVGFNSTAPIAKPTVTGAKGSNAALASLMTALAAYGLVTDSTTA